MHSPNQFWSKWVKIRAYLCGEFLTLFAYWLNSKSESDLFKNNRHFLNERSEPVLRKKSPFEFVLLCYSDLADVYFIHSKKMVLNFRIKAFWFIKNIIVRIWSKMYREQNRRFLTIVGAYEEQELVLISWTMWCN